MNDSEDAHPFPGAGYPPEVRGIFRRQPPEWAALDVGSGWWALLARLDARLAELDPDYTINQVKEKLGGLNYNASTTLTEGGEEGFHQIVRDAEREASVTCDRCGRPGVLRVNRSGFYQTLCENHSTGFKRVKGTAGTKAPADPRGAATVAPPEKLTKGETVSAIAGGVPPEVFTEAGRSTADKFIDASAGTVRAIQRTWPSARDVSVLLRVEDAGLRRKIDAGELSTAEVDGVLRIAPWQVGEEGLLLPGVGDVLKAMPPEYTALDVQTVMANPNQIFDGRAPRDLLNTPGGVKTVVDWANELALS